MQVGLSSGFELINEDKKTNRAVLVIHGLTGSPFEMKKFGTFLFNNNFDIYGVCLPGHGDLQSDIYTVTCEEWMDFVSEKFENLCKKYEEVYVAGLCLGAVLSLYLAEKYGNKVKGIVSLSTTLYLDGWRLPWYSFLMPIGLMTIFRYYYTYPECEPYGVKNERTRASIKKIITKTEAGMDNYPMCAFHELLKLSKMVRNNLEKITSPILLVHSKEDDLTSSKSANEVYKNVSSENKKLIILEDSYHMVLYDNEKEFVFNQALDFLNSLSFSNNEAAAV